VEDHAHLLITIIAPALADVFHIAPLKNPFNRIFCILENKIMKGKKANGRPGMDFWQISVLAQVRLALHLSYDRLDSMANYDRLFR